MRTLLLILPLAGCMQVDMGTPIAFPSACWGDKECQRNLDAQTLYYLGHQSAATSLMCNSSSVREVMGDECGNNVQ